MKNTIFAFIVLLGGLLSSCTTYYFTTVKSYENQLPQNEDGSFLAEKKDVAIIYSFQNDKGDIVYDIINDSDDPYMVDWERSVLIVENKVTPINRNSAQFKGSINTTTYRFGGETGYTSGSVSGSIFLPQNKLFITPHSKVSYSPVSLFETLLSSQSIKTIYRNVDKAETKIDNFSFTEFSTPLTFKSYVTVINDNDKSRIVFEDTFYVANYSRAANLKGYKNNLFKKGNTFFFKETQGQNALIWGSIIGLTAVAAALAPENNNKVDTMNAY